MGPGGGVPSCRGHYGPCDDRTYEILSSTLTALRAFSTPPTLSANLFAATRCSIANPLEESANILGLPALRPRRGPAPAFFPFFEYLITDARLAEILIPFAASASFTFAGLAS